MVINGLDSIDALSSSSKVLMKLADLFLSLLSADLPLSALPIMPIDVILPIFLRFIADSESENTVLFVLACLRANLNACIFAPVSSLVFLSDTSFLAED